MRNWEECKLGDIVFINKSCIDKNYPYNQIEYLDTGSITNGKIDSFQYFPIFKAPSRAKRLVSNNDIIYSTVRPIQRHYGFITKHNENLVVSTGFVVISTNNNKADPKFIYYFLTSDECVEYLDIIAEASTSTYPSLKPDDIANLNIFLPSLPEQKAIASVLSSLDDKIDLLYKQNKILETLSETIYRKWFVEDNNPSWSVGKINIIVDHLKNSISPKKNPQVIYDYYSIQAFDEILMPNKNLGISIQSNKYLVKDKTILFSKLNPHKVKRIWLIDKVYNENSVCSTEFQVIKPKNDSYLYFLYLLLKSPEVYNEIASGIGGTSGSHQRIDPETIFSYEINLPEEKNIERFNELVIPLFKKHENNKINIQTLKHFRDLILPKLISGEMRIKM